MQFANGGYDTIAIGNQCDIRNRWRVSLFVPIFQQGMFLACHRGGIHEAERISQPVRDNFDADDNVGKS